MPVKILAVLGKLSMVCMLLTGCASPVLVSEPTPGPAPAPAPALPPRPAPAPAPVRVPLPVEASPRPVEPDDAPPVYNASLWPQLPRDTSAPGTPVLNAGKLTTLALAIGPKRRDSSIPPVVPNADILRSEDDLPLTVLLACTFCETGDETPQRMTYRPGDRKSNEIRLRFTPLSSRNAAPYTDTLQITIVNELTGREYDRLTIPVEINSPGARIGLDPHGEINLKSASIADDTEWKADVILYVTAASDRNVSISVRPISADLTRLLGPLALDADGHAKTFRSGIDELELVNAMTNTAYGAVSAISVQGELLKRMNATGANAYVSKESQEKLELTDFEANNVTEILAASGRSLYRHLYHNSADEDLTTLIARLEEAAADPSLDRPLRMVVVTDRLSLPWQYLHPMGEEVDPQKFWGVRFSISVLRANNRASDKPVSRDTMPPPKVLFARYARDDDPSAAPAGEQISSLLALPLAEDNLLQIDSGPTLLKRMSEERRSIGAIITFLHASIGSDGMPPDLKFNDGDTVSSVNLENLLNVVKASEQKQRYLARAPLVILNACETGPARNLPHVKLQDAMFRLGAGGVVVTEVSVWVSLGHAVASRMITRLGKGETASDALTMIRRELVEEKRNPLGLLYAYYGDPAATLQRSPKP